MLPSPTLQDNHLDFRGTQGRAGFSWERVGAMEEGGRSEEKREGKVLGREGGL